MDLQEIGEIIKERRSFLKLRQEDLTQHTGITERTIQLVEQGKANPSFTTLSKILDIIGMEVIIQVKDLRNG